MTEGPIGEEFISISNLAIGLQNILKKIDLKNELLKYKIRWNGGNLYFSPEFTKKFEGIPYNQAVENHYSQLEQEVDRLDPEKKCRHYIKKGMMII